MLETEAFPAASFAFTEKEYVVVGESPVTVYVVEAVEPINEAPWYTSYPVTPTLSVAPDHERLVVVAVVPEAARVGAVGATVSGVPEPAFTEMLGIVDIKENVV